MFSSEKRRIVALIAADAEWGPTKKILSPALVERSPYGEFFTTTISEHPVVFAHGGWGKIRAAASTEHAIERWRPQLLINLGTCGGIEGQVSIGERLLITRAITYDIGEAIGDPEEALAEYATEIDLSWATEPFPVRVRRTHLLSADRDLVPSEIPALIRRYSAVAADWESGAIAYVAKRRGVPLLILRGVSDLVNVSVGQAVGNVPFFESRAATVMRDLVNDLREVVPYAIERICGPTP